MPVLEIIGWVGSAILVWSLMQTQIIRLRLFNLVGCIILIGYNAALEVWPMAGLNTALLVINVVNLVRLRADRQSGNEYEVVEVAPDSAYLQFLLRKHAADIAQFSPGFTPDALRDGSAFLILHGDETAGYVLLHDAGDGVAQIDLDYVTERFRTLSPGRFVFHSSGLLPDKGFRRVLTAPGTTAGYYEKIGFTPAGAGFEFELPR